MREEHKSKLRSKFDLVNIDDQQSLRAWFDDHAYLSTNDHAQIMGKSASYVRSLKHKVGIRGNTPDNIPTYKNVDTTVVSPPPDWDTEKWLRHAAKLYSASQIAKACGVSRKTIVKRYNKFGIEYSKSNRSRNPNCTRSWCYKHYIELGLNQTQCAKKAGISQQTFANWLNKFGITVRTSKETQKGHINAKLWVRKLINDLEQQDIVNKVYLRSDHVHVRFKNYFWETYYLTDPPPNKRCPPLSYYIKQSDATIQNIPAIVPQYEHDLVSGNAQPAHVMVNRSQLKTCSFIEKRLVAHQFCRLINQRGWIWPEHPDEVINQEWADLKDYVHSKYIIEDYFTVFAKGGKNPAPGRKMIEHYFDISQYADVFTSPRLVMRMINELIDRHDLPFDTHNLLRIFSCGAVNLPKKYPRFRLFDPAAYATIFQRLGVNGSLLDIKPGFGNRALAAAINGLEYYTVADTRFKQAIDKGLLDKTGLRYQEWAGQVVDTMVYDNNFETPDMDLAMKFVKYTKRLIVFVPNEFRFEFQSKYKPESVLKIKTRWFQKSPDFLFIW